MAGKLPTPRKQRTRDHVVADLGLNYLERFILKAGHTAHRVEQDYGYDLILITYDEQGFVEPGHVLIQLKSSARLARTGPDFSHDVDIRDYNLWTIELMPVFLVFYDESCERGYWVHVQEYFEGAKARRPRAGAKTVRVRVTARNKLSVRAMAEMRQRKLELYQRKQGTPFYDKDYLPGAGRDAALPRVYLPRSDREE